MKVNESRSFGELLKKFRCDPRRWDEKWPSQAKLAELVNVSHDTIESYEQNKRFPSEGTFEKLAEVLHLTEAERIELASALRPTAEQKRYRTTLEQPGKNIVDLPIADDILHEENEEDNNQTVTTTPSDTAEATSSSSNEWKPRNKIILSLYIINVAFAAGAIYFFLQKGVVTYIITSVLGVMAVYDIALIPLLNSHNIEQGLKKWLKLPEAASSKKVVYRVASIKVSLLLITILTLTVTLRLLSVNISGVVSCVGGEQVHGVWIQSVNGDSGFASKNKANIEGSEVVFNFTLQYGGAYNVHVGCGGSEYYWNNSYYTENGTGTIQDHNFHYFACLDVPTRAGNGPCLLKR